MRIFEAFSGYGGWSGGLKIANIPHEVVGYSEVDKYAIQCYEQNHQRSHNYGDITQIDYASLPDFDVLCASPPCQAFSVAGKGQGADDEKGRGRLFEHTIELMRIKQPKFAWYENVKGLVSKKHTEYFESILKLMRDAGYKVQWQVLNTKEHGIPQNRERVFILCIRNDIELEYKFPEKEELKLFLKDILEPVVDEKYYLKPERVEKLLSQCKPHKYFKTDVANCQTASMWKGVGNDGCTCVVSQPLKFLNRDQKTAQGEYSGCVDSAHTNGILQVGNAVFKTTKRTHETSVKINKFLKDNKKEYTLSEIAEKLTLPKTQVEHYFRVDDSRAVPSPDVWLRLKTMLAFDDSYDNIVTETYEKEIEFESSRRVYSQEGCSPTITSVNPDKIIQVNNPTHSNDRVYLPDGLSPALNTMQGGDRQPFVLQQELSVRKLTPKECFRLQGFLQDQINLEGLSATQQYKLAGNGVSINVIKKLMENLVKGEQE